MHFVFNVFNYISNSLLEWSKGQICLAPYSGDNEYYEAVINSLHKGSSRLRMAVVTFIGQV